METSRALKALRDRVQQALFQMIRDRVSSSEQPTSAAVSRFGNILLLLPPLAVSFIIIISITSTIAITITIIVSAHS